MGESIIVKTDKDYQYVGLDYYGEVIDYDTFTFNSDGTDMSFSADYYDDGYYINRDFRVLKGFKSISLLAIVALVIQCIYYVGFIMGFSEVEEDHIVRMSLGRRLMNVSFLAYSLIFTVLAFAFLADLFFNFVPYLYDLRDTLILIIVILLFILLTAFALYSTLTKQDYEFNFESNRLIVNYRKKELFNAVYADLEADGTITRTANGISALNLKLTNQANTVDMNLLFMGEQDFNELTLRLYRVARVQSDDEVLDIELYVKQKNRMPLVLVLLVVVVTSLLVLLGLMMKEYIIIIIASGVPFLVLIVYFVKYRKTVDRVSIVVDEKGIKIGNDHYYMIDRIKIEHLSTGINRMLPFSINKDSYFIYINHNKIDYSKWYKKFYVEIDQYFGDKIKN